MKTLHDMDGIQGKNVEHASYTEQHNVSNDDNDYNSIKLSNIIDTISEHNWEETSSTVAVNFSGSSATLHGTDSVPSEQEQFNSDFAYHSHTTQADDVTTEASAPTYQQQKTALTGIGSWTGAIQVPEAYDLAGMMVQAVLSPKTTTITWANQARQHNSPAGVPTREEPCATSLSFATIEQHSNADEYLQRNKPQFQTWVLEFSKNETPFSVAALKY